MLSEFLTLFRAIASTSAGTEIEAEAAADLKTVEGIAAKHADAAAKDVADWLRARLHPALSADTPQA